jgi:hypothetical protein
MNGTTTSPSEWSSSRGRDETVVEIAVPASVGPVGASSASTPTGGRIRGRLGGHVLPFVVGAAVSVGAPMPVITRRFYSAGDVSGSYVGKALWLLDDLVYREEAATMEQVRALNALLALPAIDGFRLDLPE